MNDQEIERVWNALSDFDNSEISQDRIKKIILKWKHGEERAKALFYIQLTELYGRENVEFIQKRLFKVRGSKLSEGNATKSGEKVYFLCHYSDYPSSHRNASEMAWYGISENAIKNLSNNESKGYIVFLMNNLKSNDEAMFLIPPHLILNNLKHVSKAENGRLMLQIIIKELKYFLKMKDRTEIDISEFKMDFPNFFNSNLIEEYNSWKKRYNNKKEDIERLRKIFK